MRCRFEPHRAVDEFVGAVLTETARGWGLIHQSDRWVSLTLSTAKAPERSTIYRAQAT